MNAVFQYAKGVLFLLAAAGFFCALGWSTECSKNKSFPRLFLWGYLLYTAPAGVWGILCKLLQTSWSVYALGLTLWSGGLAFWCLYRFWKENQAHPWPGIRKEQILSFFQTYGGLFVILACIMAVVLLLFPDYLLGSHSDDGYYLNTMASLPYMEHPFRDNAATGLVGTGKLDSYVVNTFELEAAFFAWVLQIPVSLFARCFLAAFHYWILLCALYICARSLFEKTGLKAKTNLCQWVPAIVIFFCFNAHFLQSSGLLILQDSWQTTVSMHFGSSLVRVCGPFLLMYPVLDRFELDKSVVLQTLITSVVLVTRSTIALPLIFVFGCGYLAVWALFLRKQWVFWLLGIFFLAFLVGGWMIYHALPILGQVGDYLDLVYAYAMTGLQRQFTSIPMLAALIICLLQLASPRMILRKLAAFILITFILLMVPYMNGLSGVLSVYDFVMGRTISAWNYFLFSMAWIFLWMWLLQKPFFAPYAKAAGIISTLFFGAANLAVLAGYGGNPLSLVDETKTESLDLVRAVKTWLQNPYLIPAGFTETGEALMELDGSESRVNLVMPTLLDYRGLQDFSNLFVRMVAPTVKEVSANYRFSTPEDPQFGTFEQSSNQIVDNFIYRSEPQDVAAMQALLQEYPINTIVTKGDEAESEKFEEIGFWLYREIPDGSLSQSYFIYTNLDELAR